MRTTSAPDPDATAKREQIPTPSEAAARSQTSDQAAAANEATRLRRLREDARRSISANLAETIALSHELSALAAATTSGPKHG